MTRKTWFSWVAAGMLGLASGISGAAPSVTVASSSAPTADTVQGKVTGITRTLPGTDAAADAFLGIPYAEPPVGDLRWKPAAPAKSWTGVRNGAWHAAPCLQAEGGSEDCLYADIYRPAGTKPDAKLPVAVYLHGGANITGSASAQDPSRLAAESDVIVAAIQYRLGALGFLSLPEFGDASGNFAMTDIEEALRWVKKTIAGYGGDPDRVTLMGESSGGTDVCRILVDPKAKGLFHQAVIQSDTCAFDSERPAKAKRRSEFFIKRAGCDFESGVGNCLRKVPAEKIAEASASSGLWAPVADVPGIEKISKGDWNRVPLLSGSNKNEARDAASVFTGWSEDAYKVWVKRLVGDNWYKAQVEYPGDKYEKDEAYGVPYIMGDFMTDSGMRGLGGCGSLTLARAAAASDVTSWFYAFEDENAPTLLRPRYPGYKTGASHGSELSYLFPDTGRFLALAAKMTPDQKKLAETIRTYWGNFIRTGNPNGKGTPHWGPYKEDGAVMVLAPGKTGTKPAAYFADEHKCAFWASIPPVTGRGSSF